MSQLNDLQKVLQDVLESGSAILSLGAYEKGFADIIHAVPEKSRYWDCSWRSLLLELKKGKAHFWLDLVRYSECFLRKAATQELTRQCKSKVLTLFLTYDKNSTRITEIFAVDSKVLSERYVRDSRTAEAFVRIRERLPHRTLNAQAKLTRKDLKEMEKNGSVAFHITTSRVSKGI